MTKQQVANGMLRDFPWDGAELTAPLTLPGALLAPSYIEQKIIAKPPSPSSGSLRLYAKSDGKLYQLDAAGNEQPISGISQAQSDARYLPLTGGTLTGPLTVQSGVTVQSLACSGDISGNNVVATAYKWTPAGDGEVLSKDMPGRLRLSGAQLTIDQNLNIGTFGQFAEIATPVTPGTGQVRVYAKSDHKLYMRDNAGVETDLTFTQIQGDVRYAMRTDTDPFPQYLTMPEGDVRYATNPGGPSGGYLTVSAAEVTYVRQDGTKPITGNLLVSGAVKTGTKSGTPVDGDVTSPIDGMLRVDVGSNQLYFRSGGVWTQSGTPLATTDARYLQLTGGTLSGDLSFSGNGRRIRGDFNNATVTNRLHFMSVTPGSTVLGMIANGAGTGTHLLLNTGSDPNNASRLHLTADAPAGLMVIASDSIGSGAQVPLSFSVAGAERMRLGTDVTSAATIYGTMNFGVSAILPLIRTRGATNSSLSVESPGEYLMLMCRSATHVGSNMNWDGTNWLHYDTAATGTLLVVHGGGLTLYTGAAGAGNVTNITRWAVDQAGNQVNYGTLIVNSTLTVTAGITGNNGLTVYNHTMMSQATGAIGSPGGSEGQLELQNAGSGASKIAFHRTGAFAAYFGLDTDNQWAVGGWSMGNVRYVLITDTQTQTLSNKTFSACNLDGTSTIADATQHLGWVRVNGSVGIYSSTYGIGLWMVNGLVPQFYSGTNANEYLQSNARANMNYRYATGGNVTFDQASLDIIEFNTGSQIVLPDLNTCWGRVLHVKNMTGAAANVYISNGNGIYSNTWYNPFVLQHGDSITVHANQAYSGWIII